MHAAEIAANLQIQRVIVPKNAGVLSALGLLLADSIKDRSLSILKPVSKIKFKELNKHLSDLKNKSFKEMESEGFPPNKIKLFAFLDLRYLGQSYEITIPYQDNLVADFHKAHQHLYSYHHPQREVEIVNLRVKAVGLSRKIRLKRWAEGDGKPERALFRSQAIYFQGQKFKAPVFNRSGLLPGDKIQGPALIIDQESTTWLPPSFSLKVDNLLNLIIHRKK